MTEFERTKKADMNHRTEQEPSGTERTLHVGCPNLGDRETFDQLIDGMFQRRWFTNSGMLEKELEAKLAHHLQVKHCIAVCNGTIGLQLACHALDLTGEVIVPSFTFVATPHAVRWEGLSPVFADIDPVTHTICPESVKSLINENTSAIIGVHLWGHPCQTRALQALADKHDLNLIYDAAHAFSCSDGDTMIGNFGDCEVFSFHATKFFNTFEGGAIATNNDELAHRIRLMKNFGFESMDRVIHLGTNAKMAEVCAAMGLSMFEKIDSIKKHNRRNYQTYQSLLCDHPGIRLFPLEHLSEANWQYVVIEIDEHLFGSTRDDVFERLNQNQVRARRYFYPGCHRMVPYDQEHHANLDTTESLCQRVLCLPTGTAITPSDIMRVCDLILGRAQLAKAG